MLTILCALPGLAGIAFWSSGSILTSPTSREVAQGQKHLVPTPPRLSRSPTKQVRAARS